MEEKTYNIRLTASQIRAHREIYNWALKAPNVNLEAAHTIVQLDALLIQQVQAQDQAPAQPVAEPPTA